MSDSSSTSRPLQSNEGGARGIDARVVAHELLSQILRRRQALDDALAQHPGLNTLEPRDRGFARAMVTACLRQLGIIDAVLSLCLREPLKPRDAAGHDLLRLGAVQLLVLGTPAHAAVSRTVALAEQVGVPHLKALINAVLRRIAEQGELMRLRIDAERKALPDWLWASWSRTYGEDTVRAIVKALMNEPPLDISLRDPSRAEELCGDLGGLMLPTGSVRLARAGLVTDLPGYSDGSWWVQDAAASLPVRLMGDLKDKRVADLCAAPGGKTLQLAAAGAKVTALDRSAPRLGRLSENLARTGLHAEVVAGDAASWNPPTPYDAVLLDAPCSATGTARRHPDVLWLKSPGDIDKLTVAQDRLLASAAEMLVPGGMLLYCTCSLEAAEGPERIAAFLARDSRFTTEAISPDEVGGLADAISPEGWLRTLPHHWGDLGGLDGFFAARLRRAA
ncbi:RsmB/NOP family class I SAM-dependent RNA methyltransferase [Lacibacterium aquatile]|uniref:RsmB/NOP family class I SAM-dependent RNA methyltransferase n=1 Tax=Lacibacterium aquatile TaxID=1168082 RepID=A0ABW5DU35_9PROT